MTILPPTAATTVVRRAGRFANPWDGGAQHSLGAFLRWAVVDRVRDRLRGPRRRVDPGTLAGEFPVAIPQFAVPRAPADEIRITWVGHSTFLIQIGARNLLVDPMWSERASPVQWAGPRRWAPPGIPLAALPPIDAVLISHDHYDHLDDQTVRHLTADHPQARWLVPLGVGPWVRGRGARAVAELDWWGETSLTAADPSHAPRTVSGQVVDGQSADQALAITATPAQHFSGRRVNNRNETLWCGWVVRARHRALWFVGDTGRHPLFGEIGRRLGPFDAILMPIGAYDPQWFMGPVHITPEDAVAAFCEATSGAVGASGASTVMVGMHWGTFRLTDEPMNEPPHRAAQAWRAAGLAPEHLWIPRYGETRTL